MGNSKSYQYKIVEISFDQSIGNVLSDNQFSEEIQELREDLLDEIYSIINGNYLTEHQKKILFMRLMGKTQNEIAEHLGITQSAVHKAMHGNIDYKNNKKRYGGIVKKLKKICSTNPNIQHILTRIEEIRSI